MRIIFVRPTAESTVPVDVKEMLPLYYRAMNSESVLVRNLFLWPATRPYTSYGFNIANKTKFTRSYSLSDQLCAKYVRDIRTGILFFDSHVIINSVLESICVDYINCILLFMSNLTIYNILNTYI